MIDRVEINVVVFNNNQVLKKTKGFLTTGTSVQESKLIEEMEIFVDAITEEYKTKPYTGIVTLIFPDNITYQFSFKNNERGSSCNIVIPETLTQH